VKSATALGTFSEKGLGAIASFWEYVGFVANSIIFLLIGVNLVAHHVLAVLTVACFTIVLLLAGLSLAFYVCCSVFAGTKQRVTLVQQHLLVWGGLRGALALALALGLQEHHW